MTLAVLAHDAFPADAKTAVGLLRFGDREVTAVIDRERAGERVRDHVPDVQDAPIVASVADAPAFDALVIGVAPIGGAFDESWRPDVRTALERGRDVYAGLHDFLADDEAFAALAAEGDATIHDVRRPPAEMGVADGVAGDVDARVVATVGTDCSTGKMTAAFALRDAARERGLDAAVVPTGQTGALVAGWGTVVDRVPADFAAGVVEEMVVSAAPDNDLLIVEGQAAIAHPAYSGVTASVLHGAMPDALVLCHEAGHDAVHGYESFPVPEPGAYADLYESLADPVSAAPVAAGTLNTSHLEEPAARAAVESYAAAIDAPATDPVRFGIGEDVLEAVR